MVTRKVGMSYCLEYELPSKAGHLAQPQIISCAVHTANVIQYQNTYAFPEFIHALQSRCYFLIGHRLGTVHNIHCIGSTV